VPNKRLNFRDRIFELTRDSFDLKQFVQVCGMGLPLLELRERFGIALCKEREFVGRWRCKICFCASSSTEIAIMKDESLKFSVFVSQGPEKPSTYVISENVRT